MHRLTRLFPTPNAHACGALAFYIKKPPHFSSCQSASQAANSAQYYHYSGLAVSLLPAQLNEML